MQPAGDGHDRFDEARRQMVDEQLRRRGISDERVLAAMQAIPRHIFAPPDLAAEAYEDHPLPIAGGATVSQPYIVGLMTQALALRKEDRVLEIGSGSGYQTAILAQLAARVFAIELHAPHVAEAQARLHALGLAEKVEMRAGDGRGGWREQAPFDAILAAACFDRVPGELLAQLAEGGRIVYPQAPAPSRDEDQDLWLGRKSGGRLHTTWLGACRFVPLL